MPFEDMHVPLEIQRLAVESLRERDAVAILSVTSCHTSSCAATQVEDAARLNPTVSQ
jgi:hypothetical protein